jgi:hypothetical protein
MVIINQSLLDQSGPEKNGLYALSWTILYLKAFFLLYKMVHFSGNIRKPDKYVRFLNGQVL